MEFPPRHWKAQALDSSKGGPGASHVNQLLVCSSREPESGRGWVWNVYFSLSSAITLPPPPLSSVYTLSKTVAWATPHAASLRGSVVKMLA